jgi:hypothetical protein
MLKAKSKVGHRNFYTERGGIGPVFAGERSQVALSRPTKHPQESENTTLPWPVDEIRSWQVDCTPLNALLNQQRIQEVAYVRSR